MPRKQQRYCDNTCCEAPAIETVDVSVKKFSDQKRHYCGACYEAYCVGAQHATYRAERTQLTTDEA